MKDMILCWFLSQGGAKWERTGKRTHTQMMDRSVRLGGGGILEGGKVL